MLLRVDGGNRSVTLICLRLEGTRCRLLLDDRLLGAAAGERRGQQQQPEYRAQSAMHLIRHDSLSLDRLAQGQVSNQASGDYWIAGRNNQGQR